MQRDLETPRTHTCSLPLALPLLVPYELGAEGIAHRGGGGMRIRADVLLRTLLATGIPVLRRDGLDARSRAAGAG